MKQFPQAPRLAVAVELHAAQPTPTQLARLQHLAHLLRGYHVPATWALAGGEAAGLLNEKAAFGPSDDFALIPGHALCATATSPFQFRRALEQELTAFAASTGSAVTLAAGDQCLLRKRTAVLAEQGIRGVLETRRLAAGGRAKPFPSGLCLLESAIQVPESQWLSRWLLRGTTSRLRRVVRDSGAESTILVTVDTARLLDGTRAKKLNRFEKLLREITWAASREQLRVTTAGAIIGELAMRRGSRPQQSILKSAA